MGTLKLRSCLLIQLRQGDVTRSHTHAYFSLLLQLAPPFLTSPLPQHLFWNLPYWSQGHPQQWVSIPLLPPGPHSLQTNNTAGEKEHSMKCFKYCSPAKHRNPRTATNRSFFPMTDTLLKTRTLSLSLPIYGWTSKHTPLSTLAVQLPTRHVLCCANLIGRYELRAPL